MTEPETSTGITPIKVGSVVIRPMRLVRSVVGIGLVIHAFWWTMRHISFTAACVEAGVGLLFVDPTLFKLAMSARKSRSGK